MAAEKCHACGQPIKAAHKEVLSKQKLTMLQTAARHVINTGVNDFKKRDVGDFASSPTAYNNFQKLRYHGLITQVKKDGIKYRERWLITRNAWAFLRGEIDMPKWVMVRNNHIDENFARCEERISVQDVYRGSEAITTTFEYFDHDTGQQVGFRPLLAKPTPAGKTITIGFDDSLAKIAERSGRSLQSIMAANPGLKPTDIHIGKVINMPPPEQQSLIDMPPAPVQRNMG